jgi:hypothetical protein
MKVDFREPSFEVTPSDEILSIPLSLTGVWETALAQFEASNFVKTSRGSKPSLGVQGQLNDAIDSAFQAQGWSGGEGRYAKGDTWVRVSFRHSMSLGSDFLDAQRQILLEGFEQVALIYAHQQLLKKISPNDGGSLCSFERAALLLHDVESISPSLPIWLGRLDL